MEKIQDSINRFLPYGESLKTLLQHPSITRPDKKQLLKSKGIYVNDGEDETTFPLLITALVSPAEFNLLREKLQTREDREKTITRTLEWQSGETLIAAIPNTFNIQDIIKTHYPRYNVVGTPNFTMIDNNPDKICLDFKCETQNYSKDWYRSNNEFKGQVIMEKVRSGDKQVELQIIHTSPETTDVANKVVKNLEIHFKASNYMQPDHSIERILYKDFTNEERMSFFLSFTVGNTFFLFQRASYLDISHDPVETLPEDIEWLELAKVKELNINGEGLHNIPFIADKAYHKYMELCEIEIIYRFSLPAAEGQCVVIFGFPGYLPKRSSNPELVVDIDKINLDDNYTHVNPKTLQPILRREFEKMKNEKFKQVKLARKFAQSINSV